MRRLLAISALAALTALGCTTATDVADRVAHESTKTSTSAVGTTPQPSTGDATGPTTTTPPDACDALAQHVQAASKSGAPNDADEAIAALDMAVDELRDDATSAPEEIRELSEQIGQVWALLVEHGRNALRGAEETGNVEVIDLVDEMLVRAQRWYVDPETLYGMDELEAACPDFYHEIKSDWMEVTEEDPLPRVRAIDKRLTELGHPDVVDDHLGAGVLDVRDPEQATSGMQKEVDNCLADFAAENAGDNDGCDALYDACDGRDLLACNDLYFSSLFGSEYEEFGATCGGRTSHGEIGYGGWCQDLE